MRRRRTAGLVPLPTDRKSQSLQDRQFEERLRIAERIVYALRKAGYPCELADEHQGSKREELRSSSM